MLSDERKDKLAAGRKNAYAVRAYLNFLKKKGDGRTVRHNTPEVLKSRLKDAREKLAEAREADDTLLELKVQSQVADLELRLSLSESVDEEKLRRDFIEVCKDYSQAHGINREGWIRMGVGEDTLTSAGL